MSTRPIRLHWGLWYQFAFNFLVVVLVIFYLNGTIMLPEFGWHILSGSCGCRVQLVQVLDVILKHMPTARKWCTICRRGFIYYYEKKWSPGPLLSADFNEALCITDPVLSSGLPLGCLHWLLFFNLNHLSAGLFALSRRGGTQACNILYIRSMQSTLLWLRSLSYKVSYAQFNMLFYNGIHILSPFSNSYFANYISKIEDSRSWIWKKV